MKTYRITKLFLSGILKGLTYTFNLQTSDLGRYKVGAVLTAYPNDRIKILSIETL